MATKYPQGSGGPRGDDIPDLDKVSCKSELAKAIPALRIAVTVLFATFFGDDNHQAVIYHCQIDNERRTFLKGKWDDLGLDDPAAEHECEELRGKYLVQALITTNWEGLGVVYAIDKGTLEKRLGYKLCNEPWGRDTICTVPYYSANRNVEPIRA